MSENTNNLEHAIKVIAAQVFDERIRQLETLPYATDTQIDVTTQERINTYKLLLSKPYFNRKEVAIYLDVSERSIIEWSLRQPDENPFPETYCGGSPRYKREDVDCWVKREKGRARLRPIK